MKKKMFGFCLAAAFCAAAGTITETTTDETASGDWEITVAAGDSNVVTVAQSGSGKIIKKGGGYLVLRKNSTFSGGVELQEGFLMVDPDADAGTSGIVNCTALGSSDVTILGQRDGYTGYCELGIVGAGSNDTRIVTIANDIHVTGNSTETYPALVLYGQNSVLTGKITADHDFIFWDDYNSVTDIYKTQWNRYANILSCTFGEIEAAGKVGFSGFARFVFGGKVTTPKLDLTILRRARSYDREPNMGTSGVMHGAIVFTTPCAIGEIVDNRRYLYCAAANVLPGTLLRHANINGGGGYNNLLMYGFSPTTAYDQTLGGLASDPLDDSSTLDWKVVGSGSKTLTITGIAPDEGETEKELVTSSNINGTMNLTVNAYDGFTQTVSNRTHTISKTIRVQKGAFRAAGSAKFPSLTGITVDAGAAFLHDSTAEAAFPALKNLTVEGSFVVGADAAADFMATNGYTEIRLSSSATFSVPSGTTFQTTSFYLDGYKLPIGTWSHANLPNVLPEGVAIVCSSGTALGDSQEWSGAAAADNLMSTLGNWKDSPASIDLAHYTLGATVKGDGEEMVYEDGTKINKLLFRRTPASTPFTIRPATPGASLEIASRFEVTNAAQLILKDVTIATPGHSDQGDPYVSSATAMYVFMVKNPMAGDCAATNNIFWRTSQNASSLPVVFDNVTIEKPWYSNGQNSSGYSLIYCKPNSTNEVKGAFYHASWWPYFDVDTNAVLTFSGGVRSGILMRKGLSGTLVIKDKPFVSSSYFGIYEGKVVFDAENCSLKGSTSGEGLMLERDVGNSYIEFMRSYCFNGDTTLIIPGSNARIGLVEFHSTTQRFARLHGNSSGANVSMHGDPGALLEVTGGRTDMTYVSGTYSYKPLTNRVDLTGSLSLKMSATNETMTFYGKAFSTCGDLEVSAGTLDFRSDASWLHGTNVAVNGEGRLKVAKGGTFGGKFAELSLADGGVFEMPSGQSQTFLSVTTNGVVLPSGRYTSLPNGEGDFLAGGGAIVVRRKGTVVTLQ